MGGCTNCKAKSGCSDRKGVLLRSVEQCLARLYPSRVWGEINDEARNEGICDHDAQFLSEEVAVELDASTLYIRGEHCDFIYVLCVGREPSLISLRETEIPFPAEIESGKSYSEQYLRICLSRMERFVAVQQVEIRFDSFEKANGMHEGVFTEIPRSGVFDALFLRRFQRLVAILPAYELFHLDFGEISAPPLGFAPGTYFDLYEDEPHVCNYIFFPEPSTMLTTTYAAKSVAADDIPLSI